MEEVREDGLSMVLEKAFAQHHGMVWEGAGWRDFAWDVRSEKTGLTFDLKRQIGTYWNFFPWKLAHLRRHREEVDYIVTGDMKNLGGRLWRCRFKQVIPTMSIYADKCRRLHKHFDPEIGWYDQRVVKKSEGDYNKRFYDHRLTNTPRRYELCA